MPQSTLWATALLQIYRDCLLSVRLTSHREFLRKLPNCNDKAEVWERRISSSLVGELSRLYWPQRNIHSLHNVANLCCGGVCLLFPKAGVAKGQKFTNIAFSYIIIKRVPSLSSAEVNFSFHLCLHWIGMSGSWPWSKPQSDCSTEVVQTSAGKAIQRVYQFGTALMWLGFHRKTGRFGCLWNVEEDGADDVERLPTLLQNQILL